MKAMEKKPTARPRIIHHGFPGMARSQEAHAQRKQISQILRNNTIQAKLTIGQPNDKYEQEADRVADEVMRMPEPEEEESLQAKPINSTISPLVQRQPDPEEDEEAEPEKEEEEEPIQTKPIAEGIRSLIQRQEEPEEEEEAEPEKEEESLQKKSLINRTKPVHSELQGQIHALKDKGQTLAETERTFFESRFGTGFSDVRVHNNLQAAHVAGAINARAFTLGNDVVFGAGQYAPHTTPGRRLMAHEFTHVVQQTKKSQPAAIQRWPRGVHEEIIIDQQRRRQRRARVNLPRLERAIDQQARQQNVPATILRGIIHFETLDRGMFESYTEGYGVLTRNWDVSLGPGDIQVRRAADIRFPGRNWTQNPLTSEEFDQIVGQLHDPGDHARILAQSMRRYFDLYGRVPGKTVPDRWRFAIASHKWGDGNVRNAQARTNTEGGNGNSWSDVTQYVDGDVVEFVNNVTAYRSTRLLRNPYL